MTMAYGVLVKKKMDCKRRIVIPKEAAKAVGLEPGDEVTFSVVRGKIVVSPKRKDD